jgi:hypothetical protein
MLDTEAGSYKRSTSNLFWSDLLPNDALLLTTSYEDNMVKTQYDLSISRNDSDDEYYNNKYLGNNDYSFTNYEKDEENGKLRLYFKYNNREGDIQSTIYLYCVKDNKLYDNFEEYTYPIDDKGEADYSRDIIKKGEKVVATFDYNDRMKNCDSFIYFVSGFFKN